MTRYGRSARGAWLVLFAALFGCESFHVPWEGPAGWDTPPAAAADNVPSARDQTEQRVVVLGHFRTPAHPLAWENVGPGMSDALARTLLNHGDFDVWINPNLARRVETLLDTSPDERAVRLTQIREAFPEVRLVVTGRVTDFHHTTDFSDGEHRMFDGASEAVVAIQMNVFDLELGRVVASDHIHGVAPAPARPSSEMYASVDFDSYLFWSTPLGKASAQAVNKAMDVLNRVVPTRDESIRIVKQIESRRVRIAAGSTQTLDRDRRYYVYVYDETTSRLVPVLDRDTRLPLQARIDASSRIGSTAWLMGEKPLSVDLRGAVLRTTPPSAAWADAAVDTEGPMVVAPEPPAPGR